MITKHQVKISGINFNFEGQILYESEEETSMSGIKYSLIIYLTQKKSYFCILKNDGLATLDNANYFSNKLDLLKYLALIHMMPFHFQIQSYEFLYNEDGSIDL